MSFMYLSYADDDGFNGGCVVEAEDLIEAAFTAIILGCRPEKGGEILGVPLDSPGPLEVGRLYSRAEMEAME